MWALLCIHVFFLAHPTPPQHPEYDVLQYNLNDFTVSVEWESPASDGGVGIDSYTLTGAGITAPLTVLSNEPLTATLTLSYNEMHVVSITASNSAGQSTASMVTIHEGILATWLNAAQNYCHGCLTISLNVVGCGPHEGIYVAICI